MILTVRPASPAEASWFASHLREEDEREVTTATGRTTQVVLLDSLRLSRGKCYTVRRTVDGKIAEHPCAIFGVVDDPNTPGAGIVWLLATPDVRHCAISLLREASVWITHWTTQYPSGLHNIVDTRNALHIRWLKLLGFRRVGPTLTINGQTFKHMVRYV